MIIKTILNSLLLSSIFLFSGCFSDLVNKTPKCSANEIVTTLGTLLNTESRKATIDMDMIREVNLNEQNGMRTCQTNVDYVYSVDKENPFISSMKKAMTGSKDGISKMNDITYTILLGETGKKYIVMVKD